MRQIIPYGAEMIYMYAIVIIVIGILVTLFIEKLLFQKAVRILSLIILLVITIYAFMYLRISLNKEISKELYASLSGGLLGLNFIFFSGLLRQLKNK